MAYYVPPSEKVGGHVPRVPHQIVHMIFSNTKKLKNSDIKRKKVTKTY